MSTRTKPKRETFYVVRSPGGYFVPFWGYHRFRRGLMQELNRCDPTTWVDLRKRGYRIQKVELVPVKKRKK